MWLNQRDTFRYFSFSCTVRSTCTGKKYQTPIIQGTVIITLSNKIKVYGSTADFHSYEAVTVWQYSILISHTKIHSPKYIFAFNLLQRTDLEGGTYICMIERGKRGLSLLEFNASIYSWG